MKNAGMKNDLRNVFVTWKPYIKFAPFLARNRISPSAFSKFLKGEQFNYEIDVLKLNDLYIDILETLEFLKVT